MNLSSINNTNFKGTVIATNIIRDNTIQENANARIDTNDVVKIKYDDDKQTTISYKVMYQDSKRHHHYPIKQVTIPYNIDRVLAAYTACRGTDTEVQL